MVVDPNKVFVQNLTWETTEEELVAAFCPVADVTSVEIRQVRSCQSCRAIFYRHLHTTRLSLVVFVLYCLFCLCTTASQFVDLLVLVLVAWSLFISEPHRPQSRLRSRGVQLCSGCPRRHRRPEQ